MAWDCSVRGAERLAATLREQRGEATLFRELATLRTDAPVPQREPDALRWHGADRAKMAAIADRLAAPRLLERVHGWAG